MRKILGNFYSKFALIWILSAIILQGATVSMQIDKTQANAYEQINLWYEIENYNATLPKDILAPIEGVDRALKVETNGTKQIYRYALFAGKSFTIPPVTIEGNRTKALHIKITPIDIKDLVDQRESYPKEPFWQKAVWVLTYSVLFILGFIVGKIGLFQKLYQGVKNQKFKRSTQKS